MWGMLKKQDVNDRVINYWPLLSLTRSVASVDVYVANGIDYFILKDITLFHVPDKGLLGNVPANVTDGQALEASSPADMQTGLTLESDSYNSTDRSIANKLYLYDNDTENETADKKHTRLVIGAEYKGTKGYYPVDFEDTDADKLIKSYGTRSTYSISILPTVRDIRIRKQPPASLPSISMSTS